MIINFLLCKKKKEKLKFNYFVLRVIEGGRNVIVGVNGSEVVEEGGAYQRLFRVIKGEGTLSACMHVRS